MADEKLKVLEENNHQLWFEGSPVMMCSMRLCIDMATGEMFTSAKFQNVQPDHIKSITFDVVCYDEFRNQIDVIKDIRYSGFDVPRNLEFGYNRRIPVPNTATRNVEYVVKNLTNLSGNAWINTENKRFNRTLEQKSIYDVQGDYNKQFLDLCARSGFDGTKLIFQPVFERGHWLCACGCLNWNDETDCAQCGAGKLWLERYSNVENLKKHAEYQAQQSATIQMSIEDHKETAEEIEQRKAEYEKRRADYQKQLKKQKSGKKIRVLVIILLILTLCVAAFFGVVKFVIPYIAYSNAENALNSKDYDAAITGFKNLDGFINSDEMLNKSIYSKANDAYENGRKEEAAKLFKSIDSYFDSHDRYLQSMYDMAVKKLDEKNYSEAAKTFTELADYKDSEQQLKNTYDGAYADGKKLLGEAEYDAAYGMFEFLGDFKDSPDLMKECIYLRANKNYEMMKYSKAFEDYKLIKGYKDVDKRIENNKQMAELISSAKDGGSADWKVSNMPCSECGEKDTATYTLSLSGNGSYSLTVVCSGHPDKPVSEVKGRYKIEKNVIFDYDYKGKVKWHKIADIKGVAPDETVKDCNTVLKITNAFMGTDDIVSLYGNIVSEE